MFNLLNQRIEKGGGGSAPLARPGIVAPPATGLAMTPNARDLTPRLNYGIEYYSPQSLGLSGGWTYGGANSNAGLERPFITESGLVG